MTIKLVLAGCGNMGYAMLAGWLKSGKIEPAEVMVIEPNGDLRTRAGTLGCQVAADISEIADGVVPQLIVIAVKPQVIRDVTAAYSRFGDGTTTFLSIAAGTAIETFESILGKRTPVVRCMPNLPASVGQGMMVVFSNGYVSDVTKRFVTDLLSANGEVASIDDESQMDAVTAVSGSGPGYVFHFIEALTAAGEKAGLPAETASLLAKQTVYGSAFLAAQSNEQPGTLREQVTSLKGTTAAALDILMGKDRLKNLLGEAVEAARLRSIELGK